VLDSAVRSKAARQALRGERVRRARLAWSAQRGHDAGQGRRGAAGAGGGDVNQSEALRAHEGYLRRAILLAASARAHGNAPFGAVLVRDGTIVATAENTVLTTRDLAGHAEMNLLRSIGRDLDAAALADAVLYASTEPCAMCSGAIYWAGLRRVVYGCPVTLLAALGGAGLVVPCRDVFAGADRLIEVHGPLLVAEAAEVHRGFWCPHEPA
jgi:tRNA(Arg) A34 adenosine deaminase TadA